jgi:YegS/Rv2252/BmrU family lipid kinase
MVADNQRKNLPPKPRTYVVINPVSGDTEIEDIRETIGSALRARDISFEIYETKKEDNLREKVHDAVEAGFQLVALAGGDGTVSGVVSGLAGSNVPLLILPTGTWNVLARALDIPAKIEDAIDLLFQEHQVRTLDAMQVGKNYYVLNISTGISARTMGESKREDKRRLGRLENLRKAIANLLEFRSYRFQVKIDGRSEQFWASELMVANSGVIGIKAVQLDENIRVDDGRVNVCRIHAHDLGAYLRLAWSVLKGDGKHAWEMSIVEATEEVEIDSSRKLQVQGDGDLIGNLPITIKVRPQAVQIITPISQGD